MHAPFSYKTFIILAAIFQLLPAVIGVILFNPSTWRDRRDAIVWGLFMGWGLEKLRALTVVLQPRYVLATPGNALAVNFLNLMVVLILWMGLFRMFRDVRPKPPTPGDGKAPLP